MIKNVGCKYCSNLKYSDLGYTCIAKNTVLWDKEDIPMPNMCLCSEKMFDYVSAPISDTLMYKHKYNRACTDVHLLESRLLYYKSVINKYESMNHPAIILLIFSLVLNLILLICVL